MIRRKLVKFAAISVLATFGTALPLAALAQSDYPNKPVKIIVPFPAGGTSDVMGRLAAEELGKQLKQPFIVENIGGAGGVIGTERATNAAPDGYTLVLSGVGQNAVAHGLDPKPQPIVDKLEAAMVAMTSPAVKQRLESQGFMVPTQGAKPYAEFVKSEEARWTQVIKTAGIKTP